MKKITLFVASLFLTFGTVWASTTSSDAQDEAARTVMVYTPGARATTLENGKKYFIYNTTFNGSEDRTGFLYDTGTGIGHSGAPKKKPTTACFTDNAYLWEVVTTEESATGHKYHLKAANGGYVSAAGVTNNAEAQDLYIQPWTTSKAPKPEVKSENTTADGTVETIGDDVWTICGTGVESNGQANGAGDCWNGNPNTWARWASCHPYAFYEVDEEAVVFEEGYPLPGHSYYIYCDNDSRQYFYNGDGSLKVADAYTDSSNEYLFTCSYDGQYFQFKNMKGKYLGFKGLADSPYHFDLRSYEYNGDKRIALYAVAAAKYVVMKNNGAFDQADGTFHAENSDFSTSFKFEEFVFPKDGETYYIYSDTYQSGAYVNRYLYADGSALKMNTSLADDKAYEWTCSVTADGVQFCNGNGKYLKHKGVQDSPYYFKVDKAGATHAIAAALYAIADNRYFVVKNDGTAFDQADRTYNQVSENYCTDFVFMSTSASKVLTVSGPAMVGASATWNGETKPLPASWTVVPGSVITDPTMTISFSNASFVFDGLYEGETALGNTVEIAELNTHRNITARFAPDIFATQYGDKWTALTRADGPAHAITLTSKDVDAKPIFSTIDYSHEGILWCFVGTPESFKIYHKVSGDALALTPSGTPANGVEVKMVAAADAQSWHLIEKARGYAIAPVGNEEWGINSYGGVSALGNPVKFYGVNDSGTWWHIHLMDLTKSLTLSVEVDKVWESSPRVAELTFGINGTNTQTRITGDVEGATYYLPAGATFTLRSMTYRGYTFDGFGEGESYTEATLPEGGLALTASYTANDERTLYYSPGTTGKPYRIPAIATAPNGHIFAIADYRPCGGDIGNGEVDVMCRISADHGATWSDEFFVANGQGGNTNEMTTGYGDAAIVADRDQNKLLVMMVCGKTICHDGRWDMSKIGDTDADAVNRVARRYAEYDEAKGEWEWSEIEEVTDDIYSLFLNGETPTVTSMFIGSGKICQSRVVKKGEYYRLYCAMWTRDQGNRVIYSDDFGQTWNVLGTIADRPAPNGDEPKCEELPDGTVVLSSRVGGGRFFNLFTFSDDTYTTGTWGTVAKSTSAYDGSANGTNGEIYKVKAVRKSDGKICDVMLQSVPAGPGRTNVKVYYKEMDYTTAYTPATFAEGWTVGKHVSDKNSCYSTMIMQADGRIAFLFEEEPNGYCIVYIPYTLEELTGGHYSLYQEPGSDDTAIECISTTNDAAVYDLTGRRVDNPTRGIYIVNGKKVIR